MNIILADRWKSFLGKRKINIGIWISLFGILGAVSLSMFLFYSYLGQFHKILEDQNRNQDLKTAFGDVEDTFQHYAWNRQDDEIRQSHENARARMESQLKKLPSDYGLIGRERYLRPWRSSTATRAIPANVKKH